MTGFLILKLRVNVKIDNLHVKLESTCNFFSLLAKCYWISHNHRLYNLVLSFFFLVSSLFVTKLCERDIAVLMKSLY